MRITIQVSPEGELRMDCDEDRPWAMLQALNAAVEAVVGKNAQEEASAPKLVVARGPLNGAHDKGG